MQNYATGKYLGVVDEHTALGYQRYNGLLLSVQRRSVNGITASANYTLSKCMGLPTQGGTTPNVGSGYVDPTNPDYDGGAVRHRPAAHLQHDDGRADAGLRERVAAAVASDWSVSGIARLLGPPPQRDPDERSGADRHRQPAPQPVGNPYGDKSYTNYLNRAAFAEPALGTLGNLERNGIVGPGTRWWTCRSSACSGSAAAPDRGAARGVQCVQLVQPAPTRRTTRHLNNVQFGRITAADDPRIMQFAIKYSF